MTKPVLLKSKAVEAPKHLSREMKAFYLETKRTYHLFDHHLEMLNAVCTLLDRANQARAEIKKEGAFILDRYAKTKSHPALAVERDSLLTASRILTQMGLDIEPPTSPEKPLG